MYLRFTFLWLVLSATAFIYSQVSVLETNVNQYPKIDVRFNLRNPNGLDTNKVRFSENGKALEKYKLSKQDSTSNQYAKKQVLVLVENSYWSRFEQQRKSIQKLWSEISDSVFNDGDQFFLATFDWSNGGQTLRHFSSSAFEKSAELNKAIQQISAPPKDGRLHESTEIYVALREGITFLNNQIRDSLVAPVILLFSSEFNNVFNNSQTKADVIIEARKSGIPIYAFRYPYSEKYDLIDVAQSSYGRHVDMRYTSNSDVIDIINDIPKLYGGHDYFVSYDSESDKYGDLRTFTISLGPEDEYNVTFQAPTRFKVFWNKAWFRYTALLVLLILVIVIAFLIQNFKKKKREEQAAIERLKQEMAQKIEDNEMLMRTEKQAEIRKKQYEDQLAFEMQLEIEFRKLNRYPSLVSQKGEVIEIDRPVFTIGRMAGNALEIDESTISKVHVGIYFDHLPGNQFIKNQRCFFLVDLNSTNGTLLNGRLIPSKSELNDKEAVILQNNDLIQIGEVTFTFLA